MRGGRNVSEEEVLTREWFYPRWDGCGLLPTFAKLPGSGLAGVHWLGEKSAPESHFSTLELRGLESRQHAAFVLDPDSHKLEAKIEQQPAIKL